MFRDQWAARLEGARSQSSSLQREIRVIDKKVEQLLDRIVDASSDSVVSAYEKRVRDLEAQKALMQEKIASCCRPPKSFGETYRTAFDFPRKPLANSRRASKAAGQR